MVAGPARSGVPMGTTAIISSFTASTQCPVVIYLMESTSRIMPPAIANDSTLIFSALKIARPKNKNAKPTIAAVKTERFIVFLCSRRDIPSLIDVRNGTTPSASSTMNRGTNVNTKDCQVLCISNSLIGLKYC